MVNWYQSASLIFVTIDVYVVIGEHIVVAKEQVANNGFYYASADLLHQHFVFEHHITMWRIG